MAHRVVIVGGGFGGLWAARGLRRAAVEITLVDRSNHHLFQPLLYQVATAGLSAPAIAAPLRHLLRGQKNLTVLLGEVERVDLAAKTVGFGPHALPYDTLVLAPGATHSYFGHDAWATHAPGLKTLDDAFDIRRRVLRAFEEAELEPDPVRAQAWLNFVVIGAGPTGVELAGTLAELSRHTLIDEFRRIDPRRARVELVEAGPRVLAAFDEDLSAKALAQLRDLGVDVRLGTPVTHIDAGGVVVGERRIDARTVIWAAGVAASPLGRQLGVPLDRAGRVAVEADLTVPGHRDVFVIGDLASVKNGERTVPGIAPAAKQMGRYVARVVRGRAASSGTTTSPPEPFRYLDQGNLATIGRMAAVIQLGPMKLSGLVAWWAWLAGHIFFLIGFRNRLVVMIDWAWAYWTYERHARVFAEPEKPKDG